MSLQGVQKTAVYVLKRMLCGHPAVLCLLTTVYSTNTAAAAYHAFEKSAHILVSGALFAPAFHYAKKTFAL